jgi:uncharacterized protein
MIVYFESSALAKQFLAETMSREVADLMEEADASATSILSRVEVSAALAKAVRMQWTTAENDQTALKQFHRQWVDLPIVEVSEAIVGRADALAWDFGLRGYDAMHLASAVAYRESLGKNVLFASFDRELRKAAAAIGFELWPKDLNN